MSPLFLNWQHSLLALFLLLLESVAGYKCFSCGSAKVSSSKFKNGTFVNYFKALPYVSNKTCDTVTKSLPIVPCSTMCIKVNLLENNGLRILEPNPEHYHLHPIVIRDCWSRVMKPAEPPKNKDGKGVAMIDKFGDVVGRVELCRGLLCNWCCRAHLERLLLFFAMFLTLLFSRRT